jgi:hypothetical protein
MSKRIGGIAHTDMADGEIRRVEHDHYGGVTVALINGVAVSIPDTNPEDIELMGFVDSEGNYIFFDWNE